MRDVCVKLSQEMDRQGYTNARMALESGVSETTIRRVRAAEGSVSIETGVAIARILNLSLDEITGLMTPPAAAALAAIEDTVREDLAEKYKPHSEHCATTCPARISMDGTIAKIEGLYRERLEEVEQLYERALAIKNTQLDKRDADIAALNAKHESDIARLKAEYEAEIATNKADYLADAATAETKYETRISRFRWGTFVMLGIILLLIVFILYLIFVDFSNPNEGILTTDLLISALEKAGYKIIAP